jgi:transcriptional regulator with XRE-family HTH domain
MREGYVNFAVADDDLFNQGFDDLAFVLRRQRRPAFVKGIRYCESELATGSSASIHMAQLPNYLRSNRKRLALSQDEMAFLLGTQRGAKVCRYERFTREPSLETALAFEVIFQRSASELFGGLYQKVEQEVAARAKALAERTDHQKANRRTAHKRQILTNIANNVLNQ